MGGPAAMNADLSSFPWCRCQQPRSDGTEEVIKAEHVLVVQQRVLPNLGPTETSEDGYSGRRSLSPGSLPPPSNGGTSKLANESPSSHAASPGVSPRGSD